MWSHQLCDECAQFLVQQDHLKQIHDETRTVLQYLRNEHMELSGELGAFLLNDLQSHRPSTPTSVRWCTPSTRRCGWSCSAEA